MAAVVAAEGAEAGAAVAAVAEAAAAVEAAGQGGGKASPPSVDSCSESASHCESKGHPNHRSQAWRGP